MPSSVGSKGFPAWPLAPPRMLIPSFSPGCFWIMISCIPGGEGSRRTNIRISCLLASKARTASWCVACRRSMLFTSNIRSPTRRPHWLANPWGITWRNEVKSRSHATYSGDESVRIHLFTVIPLRWTPQVRWCQKGGWHGRCLLQYSGLEGLQTSPG